MSKQSLHKKPYTLALLKKTKSKVCCKDNINHCVSYVGKPGTVAVNFLNIREM